MDTTTTMLNANLEQSDPELLDIIRKEKERQKRGLELIASENFTSISVLQCLSSCLHNKYSEGLPGQRYYGGNEFIDQMEILCQKRCLEAFNLSSDSWGVNVQPLSGSPANIELYAALIPPHGRIMGLDLPDGGHLSHGFMRGFKRISASSIFFESMPYKVNPETGLINYEELPRTEKLFKPNIIVAGISCYSRLLDYKKFREICDEKGAYLHSDMSHVSGLVAANLIPSPFDYSDTVMTTTHKTLRGPRAAVIFYRKGLKAVMANGDKIFYDFESKVNQSVFPGFQGGPHNNAIAAIATAMLQAKSDDFRKYQQQVIANAKHLANVLINRGYTVVTGGTDVHMVLIDLKNKGVSGAKAEKILESVSIACNKNTVPGDKNALSPSGIRLGTPALTTRGFVETDIEQVVEFIDSAIALAKKISSVSGPKLVDFCQVLKTDTAIMALVDDLRKNVEEFSSKFPLPGLPDY